MRSITTTTTTTTLPKPKSNIKTTSNKQNRVQDIYSQENAELNDKARIDNDGNERKQLLRNIQKHFEAEVATLRKSLSRGICGSNIITQFVQEFIDFDSSDNRSTIPNSIHDEITERIEVEKSIMESAAIRLQRMQCLERERTKHMLKVFFCLF